MTRHRKSGFSLIEAAVVLGVVGLVIGGIWIAASAVYDNYKLNQVIVGTRKIVNNMRGLYPLESVPSITALDQTRTYSGVWYRDSIFKDCDGFDATTTSVVSPFGGIVRAQIIRITGEIKVFYFSVPEAQCNKLVTALSSNLSNNNLNNIRITGSVSTDYPSSSWPLMSVCTVGAPSTITFTFNSPSPINLYD